MPVKKVKKGSRKNVSKKVVNDLLNEIQRKVLTLKHGYIANEEIEELRKIFE